MFLFLPLVTVGVFAFNDAPYPAPPWHGFTLDWFLGNEAAAAPACSATTSSWQHLDQLLVACWVTRRRCCRDANAFLMERASFPARRRCRC